MTALCPGLVDTNLFAAAPRGKDQAKSKQPPAWLLAKPEQIARRAVRAVRLNEPTVVIQPSARLLYAIKRLTPGILDRLHTFRRRRRQPKAPQPVQRQAA